MIEAFRPVLPPLRKLGIRARVKNVCNGERHALCGQLYLDIVYIFIHPPTSACVCVACTHSMAHTWKSEEALQTSVSSCHCVGPEDENKIARLDSKCPYPLHHLAGPNLLFLFLKFPWKHSIHYSILKQTFDISTDENESHTPLIFYRSRET